LHLTLKVRLLLILEPLVLIDRVIDSTHIWSRDLSLSFDIEVDSCWIRPTFDPLEKAKICENTGGCSTHSSSAMNINFQILLINHLVQCFGTLEHSSSKIRFIEIVNREMNCLHATSFIILNHLWPIDSSVINIDLSLHIKYARDTSFHHGLGILFKLWIRPDKNSCISNLVKSKSADKVGVSLCTVAVDNVSLAHVPPNI